MLQTHRYLIRTYVDGDEDNIVSLFNESYQDYAGFVPRTPEYWKWCILSRPNLSTDGIVIVSNTDRIVGYAAVDKLGNILEFCYDPHNNGKKIVSILVSWCIDYVKHQGGNSVSLNAPVQDSIIRQVCKEMQFTQEPFPSLYLKVHDLAKLLEKVTDQKKKLEGNFEETVLFNLRKNPSWSPDHVILRIQKDAMIVQMDESAKPTITLESDLSTISRCLFGSTRMLWRAVLNGQLRIRPRRKILRAARILSQLKLNNPWYIPGADFG